MMESVTSYLQLLRTLATESKIVYLCGTGASMSLAKHQLSWPSWLLAGKDYLNSFEGDVLDKRLGTMSTDELIDAATFLLERLKDSGSYEAFMTSTIGSLHPMDRVLADAFRRVWRAGDLIVTTNYDLTIEEVVDAGAISYSCPAEILSILRGESENKVIHLHGVYDRLHGMDDIVADDPQYKSVLGNAGAQFIQNLISTHPLIIVGSGGTVEDPNLSGFMSFVVEKLGAMDITYFYLAKNGDVLPTLPSNAIPIYYGDEYEDLPGFLSELSLLRFRKRAGLRNIISVNPYMSMTPVATGFGRMHFSNGFSEFVGRDDEIERIEDFISYDAKFRWWSVVGDGGIGKSRLMLEALRNSPYHWFGFFTRKSASDAADFKPFTDTIIVFDYVLGQETDCANTLEVYLDVFRESPYKLRVMFIERAKETDEWLKQIKRSLSSESRLYFEGAEYDKEPQILGKLSIEAEKRYIESYLRVYLPLVDNNGFVEAAKEDIAGTVCKIHEDFLDSVEEKCQRPLYLSIYIEIWIGKEGNLTLSSAEELLEEYLEREKSRWKTVLGGDDELVESYLRLLAMACAIESFNITDVKGNNYLRDDCRNLTEFLDKKRNKPEFRDLEEDLFVLMDELMDDDGGSILEAVPFNSDVPDDTDELIDGEDTGSILAMDEDERFAYGSPYIKLSADPVEVFLTMLKNVGAADDDELEQLRMVREANEKRYRDMPNHAWIIEPILPDIIREYIVSSTVGIHDAVRFTKLARANSVYGIVHFLTLALSDWPRNEVFQKMVITPPDEVLNYFEYYVGLLVRIDVVESIKKVEKELIETVPAFPKFEMDLWYRIACTLCDRGDSERLFDSGCSFIEYLKSVSNLIQLKDNVVDIIRVYSVGIHNDGKDTDYEIFIDRIWEIESELPKSSKVGLGLCECLNALIDKRFIAEEDFSPIWNRVQDILESYEYSEEMFDIAMKSADDTMHMMLRNDDLDGLKKLERYLEGLYKDHPCLCIAVVAALTTANVFSITFNGMGRKLSKELKKIKKYYHDYPEEMRIRSAYVTGCEMEYLDTSALRRVPDELIEKAREWSLQYTDEIEFQEAYFGLLLARIEYSQAHDMRDEEQRVFSEMELLSKRVDYSEYHEENQVRKSVEMLRMIHGY